VWFGQDRAQMRGVFQRSWRKYLDARPLEPLEALIVEIVLQHPELHACLADEAQTERDYRAEVGEGNPFLHLGLHLAVREQIATDRPAGIRELHRTLLERRGDPHEVEHGLMECLLESLWEGLQADAGPDEARYLECVRRAALRR
jgi:hypothetical protein